MGFSSAIGLDYSALFPLLDLYDIKDRKAIFEDIQVIEMAVLNFLSEKADK